MKFSNNFIPKVCLIILSTYGLSFSNQSDFKYNNSLFRLNGNYTIEYKKEILLILMISLDSKLMIEL